MSQHNQEHAAAPAAGAAKNAGPWGVPKAIWVAGLLLVMAGSVMFAVRSSVQASQLAAALNDANASASPTQNGLADDYGLVRFQQNAKQVEHWLSLCHMQPALARQVFLEALNKGNKSGRMIALWGTFYLAQSGHLQASDIDLIVQRLDPAVEPEAEVRRVAQGRLSQLIRVDSSKNLAEYQRVPDGLAPPQDKEPAHEVKAMTQELLALDGTGARPRRTVIEIRWSSPAVALAWWKTVGKKGAWDQQAQRWVLP